MTDTKLRRCNPVTFRMPIATKNDYGDTLLPALQEKMKEGPLLVSLPLEIHTRDADMSKAVGRVVDVNNDNGSIDVRFELLDRYGRVIYDASDVMTTAMRDGVNVGSLVSNLKAGKLSLRPVAFAKKGEDGVMTNVKLIRLELREQGIDSMREIRKAA